MYKYAFFDLDGTITNPGVGITSSVAYALNKYGIDVPDKTTLYPFIGPPLIDSFMKFYGFSKEKSREAVDFYREYYSVTGIFENEIYDGIEKMLATLKKRGVYICLVTSKPEEFAVKIIEHYGFTQYFDMICGAAMDESRTRKSEVIEYAMDNIERACNLKLSKSDIIMIGDREHDILGAKEVGLDSLGVLYGYGNLEELTAAGATHIVENPIDILDIV